MQLVGLLLLVCALFQTMQALHYRGGTFRWEKINNRKINIFWRLSFKRSEGSYQCESVGSKILAEQLNMLKCKTCSDYDKEIIHRLPLTCIATSLENDWNLFEGSSTYEVKSSKFTMSYETEGPCTDSSWLYLQNFSSGRCWNLLSHVDLSIDNNNSPRVTAGLPLYRIRQGCELFIDLKASDPDGDVVRCRWADPNKQECPDDANKPRVCDNPSKYPINAIMYENKCFVKFQTDGEYVRHLEGNYYGVSVMIEDFDKGSTTPKSTVPYQFLIQVTEPGSCTGPKVEVMYECCEIKPGEQWESIISAKLPKESDGNRVEEMTYILPKGMSYTEDIPPPGRFVQSTLSFQTWKLGIYEFTITATDDFGLQGKSVTGKILVTDKTFEQPSKPKVLDTQSYPTTNSTLQDETVEDWFIKFDEPVSRPKKSAYIMVTEIGEKTIYATYDAANPDEVEFPEDNPTIARYKAPKNLKVGHKYYIHIDQGFSILIVNYSKFCDEKSAHVMSDVAGIFFDIPIPPEPTVDCDQSEITAFVPKSYAKSVNEIHLIDRRCKSNDNGTHLIIKFAYDSCGTYIKKKSSDITRFINVLRDDPEPYKANNITRKKRKLNIKIICDVRGVGIANVFFNPDTSVKSPKFKSTTTLEAMLELYEDNSYGDQVEYGTEKEVDFKDTLYFAARSHDSGKEVAIESCRATSKYKSCTKFDKKFEFIKDGCPVDDIVSFIESGSFAQRRFSIKTFAMLNYGFDDTVWVTCSFVTCNPTNSKSACKGLNSLGNCSSAERRRRKRSATDVLTQAFLEVQLDPDVME